MMSIVKQILEWNEEKLEQLFDEELNAKTVVKIAAHGAIEGMVDGCFVVGATLAVIGWTNSIVKTIKK